MKKICIITESVIIIVFVSFIELVLKLQLSDWRFWVLVILLTLQAVIGYVEGIFDKA